MTPRHWPADDYEPPPESSADLPLWVVNDSVPYAPGSETSRDAAEAMHLQAAKDRRAVRAAYQEVFPAGMTADECATKMDRSPFAIRPRVTDLFNSGFLEETGEKRRNVSGMKARVLRAVERSEAFG